MFYNGFWWLLVPVPRWPESSDHRRTVITSKRIEKREELLLLCLGQIEEALRHLLGLALVALDCALQGQRFEICIKRGRMRRPQSGAVRSLFAVSCGPAWTMPSPVSRSCSRKSPYGWMILLPSAAGQAKAPPLIGVPGGAVVMAWT